MRIALVATHFAEYVANLALALSVRHDVLLILNRRNAARELRPKALDQLAARTNLHFVPHHYAPLQPLVALRCLAVIRRFAPDVVHVQEHPTRSTAWLTQMLGGRIPLVATIHDPLPHSGNDARAADTFRRYNGLVRQRASALIVHGEMLAEKLAGITPDGRARIAVVPHGVLRFGLLDEQPPAPFEANRLIFFGRMEAYKGLDTLLDANAMWLERGIDIALTLAGAGPDLARHGERIAAMPNITLHRGRIEQARLAGLVASSAGALLPYHDATQSGVASSAFGLGKPVIASMAGSIPEVVKDGGNGLLFAPRDAAGLAEAGALFRADAALREHLATGARATAAAELGWENIALSTEAVYGRLT